MSIKVNNKKIATTISSQFDAAVVDLVTGLDKQKQVLAQALNDKGAEVTSTNTLDEMASKVKTLEVLGEKTNLKGTVLYQPTGYQTFFSNASDIRMVHLPLHGVYAYADASTKMFKILKFNNDFSYEELVSVTLEDSSINQTGAPSLFPNADETKIVVRFSSKTGSYYYRAYSFSLTFGETVSVEQIGQTVEFVTSTNQGALAGALKFDGTKFFSFQGNYSNAQVIDFINGSYVGITHALEKNAYASTAYYIVDENGFGIMERNSVSSGIVGYKAQFDFENNSVSYLGEVYLPNAKILNRYSSSSITSKYIANKKAIVLLIGSVPTSGGVQDFYHQNKTEFIAIDASNGEVIMQKVLKTCFAPFYGFSSYSLGSSSCFYLKLKNGRWLVGNCKVGAVEYDAEELKLYYVGTDYEIEEGCFVGLISERENNGAIKNFQIPILSSDGFSLYGSSSTSTGLSTKNGFQPTGSYYKAEIYPQVVWGELYKRNGNEIVRTSLFERSLYEAGAYAEKDEVAIVDVES